MKNFNFLIILIAIAISIYISACSKNGDSPSSDKATLSYKVHDSTIAIPDQGINIYMNKTGIFGTYEYAFCNSIVL